MKTRRRKSTGAHAVKNNAMKREFDFSKVTRGKYYHPNAKLNLPIYLDDDVTEFVQSYVNRKKVDAQTGVNEILRWNQEMLQAMRQQ